MSKKHLRQVVKDYFMQGKTYVEIQELTGVSPQTQCKWVKKYKWDEERDLEERIQADTETISLNLRKMWAVNLKNKKPDVKGNYQINWDAMCKASRTVSDLGAVNDELAAIALSMDKFSRYVKAQNWPPEKVNHIFEGIQSFLDKVGEEAF